MGDRRRMMMSIKLVCLAATLSAVAFAAPSTLTSEDMGMRLHESHQVTSLKKQFNELQVQLKSGAEITPAVQETIQKTIDMVTNDIEPTITEAHDADQEELNALMGAVQAHNDFTEAYTAQLLEEAADLRQKMHSTTTSPSSGGSRVSCTRLPSLCTRLLSSTAPLCAAVVSRLLLLPWSQPQPTTSVISLAPRPNPVLPMLTHLCKSTPRSHSVPDKPVTLTGTLAATTRRPRRRRTLPTWS